MGRKWWLVLFVVVCLGVAAAVAWWPRDDRIVQVESADPGGICVRDVQTGDRSCVAYTAEFPREQRYEIGECLRFVEVYPADVPPQAKRVTCPG